MPCNSDHMLPNSIEKNSRLLASFIRHCTEHGVVSAESPEWGLSREIIDAEENYYGNTDLNDRMAIWLCDALQDVDKGWIYDGRLRIRRRLADWWEEHQEADRKRFETLHIEKQRLLQDVESLKCRIKEIQTELDSK